MLELKPLELPPMAGRDAALAHAIVDSVLQRWITLGFLLDKFLAQPMHMLQPPIKGPLLVGAAQILLLDRIPAYAAINHAVEWAKRNVRPGAGGLVNAVLRKVAALRLLGDQSLAPIQYAGERDAIPLPSGHCLKLSGLVLPEDRDHRLSVATGLPKAVLLMIEQQHGKQYTMPQAMHTVQRPPVVLNTQFAPPDSLPMEVLIAHQQPGFHVYAGGHEQLVSMLQSRDDVWAQDASSGNTVQTLAKLKPKRIIDLCAGQGTKTRQLAKTFPHAKIIATDNDIKRLAVLEKVFIGSENVEVMPIERVFAEANKAKHQADLVLLDVPCSNTGVLARRPEAKYRFSDQTVEELVVLQQSIIVDAAHVLSDKPGATLVYSTCSVDARENLQQAQFAAKELGLSITSHQQLLPTGHPQPETLRSGEAPASLTTTYRDGAFVAVLTRL